MPKRLSARFKTPLGPINRRRTKPVRDGDPDYHHHWARADKIDIHREDREYEVVHSAAGGPITSGGDVLMRCRREGFEARQRERKRAAEEQRRGPVEGFKMQGLNYGVPVLDVSRERYGPMSMVLGEADPKVRE